GTTGFHGAGNRAGSVVASAGRVVPSAGTVAASDATRLEPSSSRLRNAATSRSKADRRLSNIVCDLSVASLAIVFAGGQCRSERLSTRGVQPTGNVITTTATQTPARNACDAPRHRLPEKEQARTRTPLAIRSPLIPIPVRRSASLPASPASAAPA
ncbi:MAG: hypothetical protein NZ561_13280, partial [Phycisphaerae bacterium]|nr:hypothetical protein [Phycisphaerae bacterium]